MPINLPSVTKLAQFDVLAFVVCSYLIFFVELPNAQGPNSNHLGSDYATLLLVTVSVSIMVCKSKPTLPAY